MYVFSLCCTRSIKEEKKEKKHFKAKNVKESSIRDWRKSYEKELKEKFSRSKAGDIVSVNPLLALKLDEQLQSKVLSMRTHQAVINSNIVLKSCHSITTEE